ncbi:MAG: mechanosensitive ion channel family protein [Planctomycetota bacterium]|nr:mechanosensitive ion channel family protein [Planctomycetota bacterium]
MKRTPILVLLVHLLLAGGLATSPLGAADRAASQVIKGAQKTPEAPATEDAGEAGPSGTPLAFSSPGRTISTFLNAMAGRPTDFNTAIMCLELPTGTYSKEVTEQRALNLQEILLHLGYELDENPGIPFETTNDIDVFSLLPPPEGSNPTVIQRSRELAEFTKGAAVLALNRNLEGRWEFSSETISDGNDELLRMADLQLMQKYPELLDDPRTEMTLRNWLLKMAPPWVWEQFFFISYIQWIGIGIFLVLGLCLNLTVRFTFGVLLKRWIERGLLHVARREAEGQLDIRRSARALGLVASIMLWKWLAGLLFLPLTAYNMIAISLDVLLVLSMINAGFKLTDLLGEVMAMRAASTHNKLDDIVVPLIRKTIKFVILSLGLFYLAGAVNYEITPLIAGLGIGGLGFAFAAQNSIENFFGSITVVLDRPFQVGDWVVIDNVEGNVEQVGLRSTRVRTFYNSQMTIPNSILIKTTVDNYGRRQFRRWKTTLSLLYQTTPEQVEAFCEGARELVRNHPYMRRDSYQIFLNEFGDSGINVLVYVFWNTPDWATELRERHRFMLDLMRLAAELGVEFAYPTQTVYLARASELPKQPSQLEPGQHQGANEAQGREAARRIIETASWRDHRPIPYHYQSAEESLHLDEQGEEAESVRNRSTETRGSAEADGGDGG